VGAGTGESAEIYVVIYLHALVSLFCEIELDGWV